MTNPKPQDVASDALTAAAEAYRAHLDSTQQVGVYTHSKGAAGRRNVLVVAVAFDGFMDLGATFGKVLELFAADVDKATAAKSKIIQGPGYQAGAASVGVDPADAPPVKPGDPGQQDGRT